MQITTAVAMVAMAVPVLVPLLVLLRIGAAALGLSPRSTHLRLPFYGTRRRWQSCKTSLFGFGPCSGR